MNLVEIEKRIINFWKASEIFEKSLRNNLKKKRFNWIEDLLMLMINPIWDIF
jgi:isoleucyl-tRNA synthetase